MIADSNQSCHMRTPRQTSLASSLSLSGKRHRVSVSAWTSIRRACFRRQSDRSRPGTRIAGRGQHSIVLNCACFLRHMYRRVLRIPNWTCCRSSDEICKKAESSLLRWFYTIWDTHNVKLNIGVSSTWLRSRGDSSLRFAKGVQGNTDQRKFALGLRRSTVQSLSE